MLPSLGFQEIILLGIIALVVVGPKDLPLLLRKLGKWTAKLRGMAQEFRTGFDELARQAELDELRREVDALRRTTSLHAVTNELTKPLGTLESYATAPTPRYDAPPAAPVENAEQERRSSDPPLMASEQGGSEDPRSDEQPVMRSTAP